MTPVAPFLPTAFVAHSDVSLHDTGWGHPDHQGRLPALTRAVYRDMMALHEVLLEVEATPATMDDLLLAHSAEYVEAVRAAADAAAAAGPPQRFGDAGGMISAASWNAALASVGAGLTAIREVSDGHARNAFCVSRPPGGDVSRDRQDGFGFFNHTAIAALHLRRRVDAERVLVVEWSDRPTVGTAGLLASAGGCRLVGIHPQILSADADLDDLLSAQTDQLDRAAEGWTPDWIVVGCGFDLLDQLHFDVGAAHALTKDIRKRADDLCDGRIVSLLEGGYDAERLGAAAVQHLRALADLPQG